MARCTSCGAELPDYYTSCPNCGGTQVVREGAAGVPQAQASYAQPLPTQMGQPVTSVKGWIGWVLLCSYVPIIGVIVMLCTVKDPSAKNYAKLQLIMMIIGIVLCALLLLILVPALIGYVRKAENAHVVYNMIQAFIH